MRALEGANHVALSLKMAWADRVVGAHGGREDRAFACQIRVPDGTSGLGLTQKQTGLG